MDLKVALVAGMACLATQFVHAEDCKNIKAQKERLACYDKVEGSKPKKPNYEAAVVKSKQMLTENFFDPDSAKFRNLVGYGFASDTSGGGDFATLCGEVNAKNRAGGYVGYRRFVVMYSFQHVSIEEPSTVEQIQAINEQQFGDNGNACKGPVLYKQN